MKLGIEEGLSIGNWEDCIDFRKDGEEEDLRL